MRQCAGKITPCAWVMASRSKTHELSLAGAPGIAGDEEGGPGPRMSQLRLACLIVDGAPTLNPTRVGLATLASGRFRGVTRYRPPNGLPVGRIVNQV